MPAAGRPVYTAAQVDAAVAALQQPGRLDHATEVVMHAAPSLSGVLAAALEQGGWFAGKSDEQAQKAASEPDPAARATAVHVLVAEQTRLAMLVGVAVGIQLAHELAQLDPQGDD
jgi:hypothetical protein